MVGNTAVAVRLVAIRQNANTVLRFMFGATPRGFDALDSDFMASAQSLHAITPEQAGQYRPRRIHVVTVQPGDTVESMTAQMQVPEAKDEWFRVINHLAAGAALQAGQLVKIITQDASTMSSLLPNGKMGHRTGDGPVAGIGGHPVETAIIDD
jgi:predicted Zn-dependent protease